MSSSIRLFIDSPLATLKQITLDSKQSNYIFNVMRRSEGDEILLINGKDGEWSSVVEDIGKHKSCIRVIGPIREQLYCNTLKLAFAPVKNYSIISKLATELGVTDFIPIITKRTIIKDFNASRFQANVIEAVEQSERMDIPSISTNVKLEKFLNSLKKSESVLLCEERGGIPFMDTLDKLPKSDDMPYILVGPEGGFSNEEIELLHSYNNIYPTSLGNLVLRSETAIASALALVNNCIVTK